jgi:hypothetical protein
MLTPEERQRIEDEERKRIAEEQYRAEVRARFQQPQQDPPAPVEKPNRIPWILGIGVVLIAGAVLLTSNLGQSKVSGDGGVPEPRAASAPEPVAKTRYVPATENIANGQIIVKAQGYVQYRFVNHP